jgi:GNAT superfamily N-acetyltransferase
MSNPLIVIRGGLSGDANDLLDIDIKCFDTAWQPEKWSLIRYSKEYDITVATFYGAAVGFVVYHRCSDSNEVQIDKIAVKRAFRRKGVSRLLLEAVVDYAHQTNASALMLVVPESTIYPDHPENTSLWATAVGFKATRPILKDYFAAYGETDNGVKFKTPIQNEQ